MAFTEDLDIFLDTDGFATTVTVDSVAVTAIFESAWVEVTIGQTPYSGVKPTLFGKASDFSGKFGKTVVAGGENYTIIDIQPDGSGMVLVILTEA